MSRPRLSKVAAQGVEDLRSRGIEPTLDEILWLHELGKRVENPAGGRAVDAIGWPVPCGNVFLWPFTIGAGEWYARLGYPLFGQSGLGLLVLAYALAHSRHPEVLQSLVEQDAIKSSVKEWSRGIGATVAELSRSVEKVLPSVTAPAQSCSECGQPLPPDDDDDTLAETDWTDAVGVLCHEFGHDRDFWVWQAGRNYALEMVALARRIRAAESGIATADDPHKRASREFNAARVAIIQSHRRVEAA